MAAVTGGLVEAQMTRLDPEDPVRVGGVLGRVNAGGALGGLAGTLRALPSVPQSHASLTRTVWIRRVLEQWASQQRFHVAQGESGANAGQLVFKLNGPPMPKDLIPWMTATRDWQEFALWGESGKMTCPTWDLPAGGLFVGGTCPGADAGQSIIDPSVRRSKVEQAPDGQFLLNTLTPDGERVRMVEGGTICSQCYAFEGNYPSPHVQLGEVLRYWWLRTLLTEKRTTELVDALVLSMKLIRYPETPQGILPVRIHSAGDFFSPDYADAWCAVADELWRMGGRAQRIRMWAPTRTWASGNWNLYWKKKLPQLLSAQEGIPNLMVRPSAYNFNDRAPASFVPGNAAGSTSLLESSDSARLKFAEANHFTKDDPRRFMAPPGETRYDWACPAYAIEQEKHTCANATNPDGLPHCRVCWARPEWRVHYTAH